MVEKAVVSLKDVPEDVMERYKKNSLGLVDELINVYIDGVNDILEKNEGINAFEIFLILVGFVEGGSKVFKKNAELSNDEYLGLLRKIRDYLSFQIKTEGN